MTRANRSGAPSRREEAEERPPSQADLFVQLVQSKGELFHDAEEDAYITVTDAGVTETLKLRSMRASAWMNRLYFELYAKVPGAQGRSDAINTLEGVALYGPRRAVHVRTADVDGRIVIDLGDDSRDAVDVGPEGWRIIQRPPVRFVRPRGLLPLPRPVAGGRIDDLRPLVNVEDDAQFRLLVAWLVAAQRGRGPFPILCVQGEHGSAKSTCSRFVRHLVDPKKPILRSLPKDERDLAVAARASHALAFDNLSGLPDLVVGRPMPRRHGWRLRHALALHERRGDDLRLRPPRHPQRDRRRREPRRSRRPVPDGDPSRDPQGAPQEREGDPGALRRRGARHLRRDPHGGRRGPRP